MTTVLKLLLPGGDTLCWSAGEPNGVTALAYLARITHLPLTETDAVLPPQSVQVVRGERGKCPPPFRYHAWSCTQWYRHPDGKFEVRIGDIGNYTPEMRGDLARWLFFLALLPFLENGRHYLAHGAFFQESDGRGAALFGPSGIGKSTAAASLEREGLTVFCDDAFILTPAGGKWLVNVSPTWSIYTNHKPWREFDCGATHELTRCYVIDRGEHTREELPPWQAGVLVTTAMAQLTELHLRRMKDLKLTRELETKAFEAAGAIARELPLCRLKLKLGESVLPLLTGSR